MRTLGKYLLSARKKSSLSLIKVADQTKIPLHHLRSLEKDDFSRFPSLTIAKGFTQNYAHFLKLNTRLALALLRRDYPTPRHLSPTPPSARLWLSRLGLRFLPLLNPQSFFIGLVALLVFGYLFSQLIAFYLRPRLIITSPQPNSTVSTQFILTGQTNSQAVLEINQQVVPVDGQGNFSYQLILSPGTQVITLIAQNSPKRSTTKQIFVHVQ